MNEKILADIRKERMMIEGERQKIENCKIFNFPQI